MDKRYQVFVSSTYIDLKEERQEVMQALLELDCIPSGMELFPATDDDQWTLIKKLIDDCDYYIVIVGGRYGSLSPTGISYTQMEYEYAVSQGKPVIGFLHKNPGSIVASKTEQSEAGKEKLKAFRELAQQKLVRYWETPSELGSVVSRSLIQLIKNKPGIGWVRADRVPSETAAQEIVRLRHIIDDLEKQLAESRLDALRGTEDLVQGNDKFTIHFSSMYNGSISKRQYSMNWNDIFSTLSPYMLSLISEDFMRSILSGYLSDHISGTVISIDDNDFQIIKIQLRALGLITNAENPQDPHTPHWMLTPHGDNVMMKIKAIKRTNNLDQTIEQPKE